MTFDTFSIGFLIGSISLFGVSIAQLPSNSGTSTIIDPNQKEFQQFMSKYNISFTNATEMAYRLQVFGQNLGVINQLNAEKQYGEAVFGVNAYAHLTHEEFKKTMLMADGFANRQRSTPRPNRQMRKSFFQFINLYKLADHYNNFCLERELLPANRPTATILPPRNMSLVDFDWRTMGVVTPIKNQGGCGSCWAFATAGAVESQYAIHGGGITDLSEQELVSCETWSYGCEGGYTYSALAYVQQNGLHMNSADPYTGTDSACPAKINGQKVYINSVTDISYQSEDEMKVYLLNNGPFTFAYAVSSAFQHYVSGIFSDNTCTTVNHAMVTVGYGVNAAGTPYWIVKNQWGTGWGESGYIRLLRNVDICSFTSDVLAPVINGNF